MDSSFTTSTATFLRSVQRGAFPRPKSDTRRTLWQWLFPSAATSIRQESTTWSHKLLLRGSAYVLALLVLGFLAGHRL
jgi:hypothetical protein